MLVIFHGEHHTQSRAALTQAIAAAQQHGRQVAHLEVKNLEPSGLAVSLQTQSLFAEPRTIVLEELHSLPKSKRKDELIALIAQFAEQAETEIILWEKKQLTATELKKFPHAKVQAFIPTRSMFAWLNALSGQQTEATKAKMVTLFQKAVESDGEQFCFAMLIRQVRLLMEAKEGNNPTQFKMAAQAQLFSWTQLFSLHKKLLEIDLLQKTSGTPFTISSQVELLMVTL
ncbi:hypothetical protein H3C70_01560 [Patescibacteria group bacterium]|nr:hypothetical protein [Patescibacteria group bacterium]